MNPLELLLLNAYERLRQIQRNQWLDDCEAVLDRFYRNMELSISRGIWGKGRRKP